MSKRILLAFAVWAISLHARAGLVFYAEPGSGPYCVLFDDASDTKVDFVEGSGSKAGRFAVADSAIATASLDGGVYTARVFASTAASLNVTTSLLVGDVAKFRWSGTEEICARLDLAGREYAQLAYAKLIEAAATPNLLVARLVDAAVNLIAWREGHELASEAATESASETRLTT